MTEKPSEKARYGFKFIADSNLFEAMLVCVRILAKYALAVAWP